MYWDLGQGLLRANCQINKWPSSEGLIKQPMKKGGLIGGIYKKGENLHQCTRFGLTTCSESEEKKGGGLMGAVFKGHALKNGIGVGLLTFFLVNLYRTSSKYVCQIDIVYLQEIKS